MAFLLFALAATLSSPQISEGDAIVALAWERRSKSNEAPAVQCVEASEQSTAVKIHAYSAISSHLTAKGDANPPPGPARLRRIAEGEGRTLVFDAGRLGLMAPSPACHSHYTVSAPVVLDDYAYVEIGLDCGFLCGHGEVLALERRNEQWRIVESVVQWDS